MDQLANTNRRLSPRLRLEIGVGAVIALTVLLLTASGMNGLSSRVEARQAEWLEQSVTRSAIQCYVIEGRFPTTAEGVDYLSEHYGLTIDGSRYVVYYESLGDNLLPQVKVFVIPDASLADQVRQALGLTGCAPRQPSASASGASASGASLLQQPANQRPASGAPA